MNTNRHESKTPELRFPEFDGEWVEKRLGDISTWKSGGTPSKDRPEFWDGHIPWISASSMHKYEIDDSEFKLSELGLRNGSRLTEQGTLLLLVRGSMLYNRIPLGIAQRDVAFNQDVKAIDAGSETNVFLLPWFQAKEHLLLSMVTGTGIGAGKLETSELKSLIVGLPVIDEQKKIAAFLSAVDGRIEGLEKKRELLTVYKKGLMQKLFNQSLRFSDDTGQPFPDWVERSFASLYSFESTNSFSRDMLSYDVGSVKNIHYGDIHTKFSSQFSIESELVPFVDPAVDLRKIREGQYLQEGDLVIADASEDYADIGKGIEVFSLNGEKAIAGLHTIHARRKMTEEVAVGFGAFLMQSESVRLSIMRVAQGTKVLGLSAKKFGEILIQLPSLAEQQKIADCLSALDRKIGQVEAQVSQTRTFKQGLLQRMFV